jgi:hypothetical protein
MALRDDGPSRFQDRMSERSSLVPIAVGAVIALLLGWWLMTGPTNRDAGMTRTSAPATNQTDTKTNTSGTSKQP